MADLTIRIRDALNNAPAHRIPVTVVPVRSDQASAGSGITHAFQLLEDPIVVYTDAAGDAVFAGLVPSSRYALRSQYLAFWPELETPRRFSMPDHDAALADLPHSEEGVAIGPILPPATITNITGLADVDNALSANTVLAVNAAGDRVEFVNLSGDQVDVTRDGSGNITLSIAADSITGAEIADGAINTDRVAKKAGQVVEFDNKRGWQLGLGTEGEAAAGEGLTKTRSATYAADGGYTLALDPGHSDHADDPGVLASLSAQPALAGLDQDDIYNQNGELYIVHDATVNFYTGAAAVRGQGRVGIDWFEWEHYDGSDDDYYWAQLPRTAFAGNPPATVYGRATSHGPDRPGGVTVLVLNRRAADDNAARYGYKNAPGSDPFSGTGNDSIGAGTRVTVEFFTDAALTDRLVISGVKQGRVWVDPSNPPHPVQADWGENSASKADYIKRRPDLKAQSITGGGRWPLSELAIYVKASDPSGNDADGLWLVT